MKRKKWHKGATNWYITQQVTMTMSYSEEISKPLTMRATRPASNSLPQLAIAKRELAAAYVEITSSPLFGSALLLVAGALILAFSIVHLVKSVIT